MKQVSDYILTKVVSGYCKTFYIVAPLLVDLSDYFHYIIPITTCYYKHNTRAKQKLKSNTNVLIVSVLVTQLFSFSQ